MQYYILIVLYYILYMLFLQILINQVRMITGPKSDLAECVDVAVGFFYGGGRRLSFQQQHPRIILMFTQQIPPPLQN